MRPFFESQILLFQSSTLFIPPLGIAYGEALFLVGELGGKFIHTTADELLLAFATWNR